MEKKPHKHAAAIHAFADGEQIQYRAPGSDAWVDCPDPAWTFDYEYRVKPGREYPETQMDSDDTYRAMYSGPTTNNSAQCRAQLVNVGLRHAIDNGQVVTKEEAQASYEAGRENGIKESLEHINAGTQGLIDALRLIRDDDNQRVSPTAIKSGDEIMTLGFFITRTLRAAGLT